MHSAGHYPGGRVGLEVRYHVPGGIMDGAGATVGNDVVAEQPRERYRVSIRRRHHRWPEYNLRTESVGLMPQLIVVDIDCTHAAM